MVGRATAAASTWGHAHCQTEAYGLHWSGLRSWQLKRLRFVVCPLLLRNYLDFHLNVLKQQMFVYQDCVPMVAF